MIAEYKPSPCVGSGLCCKKGPCAYGLWNEEKHQCEYLETAISETDFEVYRCARFEYIKEQSTSDISPAFGAGCCMGLFNSNRNRIIQEINGGNEQVIQLLFGKKNKQS